MDRPAPKGRPVADDQIPATQADCPDGTMFCVLDGRETRRAGFVGMLLRNAGGSRVGIGSGALVCSNVVLTVAHVALKQDASMTFTIGKDALRHARRGDTDRKVVDKFALSDIPGQKDRLSDAEAAIDIALVKLDPPFPPEVEPAKIAKAIPRRNAPFTIIGYGQNKKGSGSGTKREGTIAPEEIKTFFNRQRVTTKAVLVHRPGQSGQLGMPGDSGAPVFQEDDGYLGPIVGVHSTGNGTDKNTTALVGVPAVRERLVRKLKEWCPEGFND